VVAALRQDAKIAAEHREAADAIAFEAMNYWSADVLSACTSFTRTTKWLATSVLHALSCRGQANMAAGSGRRDQLRGHAAAAPTALNAHGVNEVDVLTHRDVNAVACRSTRLAWSSSSKTPRIRAGVMRLRQRQVPMARSSPSTTSSSTAYPGHRCAVMFLTEDDLPLPPLDLIVDGPATRAWDSAGSPDIFADPMLTVGNNVHYYGVDHSPSYLWDSATWEISEALLPHLRPLLSGPQAWDANATVRRAIEIRGGVIQNPRILSFQHRSPDYPHLPHP
jgi:hypothetical protein